MNELLDTPLVSVVMPVFNCGKTVAAAIRSILIQTYENWELIVIDDGSKDKSNDVIKDFSDARIRVIACEKNKGIAARLNQAVGLSRGRYVARMDADDVSFPRRLELQVQYLLQHPDVDLLGTAILVNSGEDCPQGTLPVREDHETICCRPWKGFYLPHPTWMGSKQWFLEHQYQFAASGAEDQDILFRSYRTSRFACLPDVLLSYRENRNMTKMLRARYAFFKALFPEAIRQKKFGIACMLAISQSAKVGGDVLNLKFGFRIFRNQLIIADPDLLALWRKVSKVVNER